jgi:hypothetical protein
MPALIHANELGRRQMDAAHARAVAAAMLTASPPGVSDAILSESEDDHGWCYVIDWTTERAAKSCSFQDAPPPGIGPIAVDKKSGKAFYLGSQWLPLELEMAKEEGGR